MVLIVAMSFPAVMAWLYFVLFAQETGERNLALVASFAAGKVVQFGLPVLYVWWFEPARLRLLLPSRKGVRVGLIFGLTIAAAIFALYFGWLKDNPLLTGAPGKIHHKLAEFGLASPVGFLGMAIFVCIVHSLMEEYYWRWFVFDSLRKYTSLWPAIIVSSLAFMAHHVIVLAVYFPQQVWTLAVPFSLAVAVGGGVWAWIFERGRSLVAPWISHVLI